MINGYNTRCHYNIKISLWQSARHEGRRLYVKFSLEVMKKKCKTEYLRIFVRLTKTVSHQGQCPIRPCPVRSLCIYKVISSRLPYLLRNVKMIYKTVALIEIELIGSKLTCKPQFYDFLLLANWLAMPAFAHRSIRSQVEVVKLCDK